MFDPYYDWTEDLTKLSDVIDINEKNCDWTEAFTKLCDVIELRGKEKCGDLSYQDLQHRCHQLLEDNDLLKRKLKSSEDARNILKDKHDESVKTLQALTQKYDKLEEEVELFKKDTKNDQLRENLLGLKLKEKEKLNKTFIKLQSNPLEVINTLKFVWETIKMRGPPPSYDLVKEEGQSHDRTFTMVCKLGEFGELTVTGEGKTKKLASRQAADKMLQGVKAEMDDKENSNIYEKDLKLCRLGTDLNSINGHFFSFV